MRKVKNKIFVAILLSASFTFAQYDAEGDNSAPNSVASSEAVQEEIQEAANSDSASTETYSKAPKVDESDPYYHAHRGLYFATSAGMAYTYLRHCHTSSKNDKCHEYTTFMTPYIESRFGGSIHNIASLYGLIGFGIGAVTSDYKTLRLTFGLGADFYPFQNSENTVVNGIFLGISAGYMLDLTVNKSAFSDDDNFMNMFYRLEIGKDSWISKRWSFGYAFNYTFGTLSLGDKNDTDSYRNHTFGLTVKIAH